MKRIEAVADESQKLGTKRRNKADGATAPTRPRKPHKPRRRRNRTISEFKAAIRRNGGLYTAIADDLEMTTSGVRDRISKSEELLREIEAVDQRVFDRAKGHILKAVDRGDLAMCKFWVKEKGTNLEYGKQQPPPQWPTDVLGKLSRLTQGGTAGLRDIGGRLGLKVPKSKA